MVKPCAHVRRSLLALGQTPSMAGAPTVCGGVSLGQQPGLAQGVKSSVVSDCVPVPGLQMCPMVTWHL